MPYNPSIHSPPPYRFVAHFSPGECFRLVTRRGRGEPIKTRLPELTKRMKDWLRHLPKKPKPLKWIFCVILDHIHEIMPKAQKRAVATATYHVRSIGDRAEVRYRTFVLFSA